MQKRAMILLIFVMGITSALAKAPSEDPSAVVVAKADSLFATRQFTQAGDLYQSVFQKHHYSPAMLLRMAFIHEGLGRLGESLFYLNLYHLASSDPQALKKMEELAEKNRLQGYEADQSARFFGWLLDQYIPVVAILASLNILLLAFLIQNRRMKTAGPGAILTGLGFTLVLLVLHVYYTQESRRAIVTHAPTYLMSGPSAGSSVVDIIGEGHQLHVRGQEDVWLKVEWKEKEVYVRDFLVRKVAL